MTISPEEFVKAWQEAGSIAEVCEKFDLKYASAANRACFLRQKGVPLKKFDRSRSTRFDYDSLKALAEKHAPKNGSK